MREGPFAEPAFNLIALADDGAKLEHAGRARG
jgi:hypothetical protein